MSAGRRERDDAVSDGESNSCAAHLMWQNACVSLSTPAAEQNACVSLGTPAAEQAWRQIMESSPSDGIWHSLENCVAYQAGVWQNLLAKGISDVMQPAAFKMAIVLRHTPSDLVVKILSEMLKLHPQCQDLSSYVLALLTDGEASEGGCAPPSPPSPAGPAPPRDLQLYGDLELAVLAAELPHYTAHAALVRAEYSQMSQASYSDLRIKILNQFSLIPKLFHTPEFEAMEAAARENIKREIISLREQK